MTPIRLFRVALLVLLAAAALPEPGSAQAADAAKTLRDRVQQFYSLMQTGRLAEAAEYVTEATRDNFRNTPSGPFVSFEVENINIDDRRDAATVAVRLQTVSRFATGPVPVVVTSRWVLTAKGWQAIAERTPEGNTQTLFSSGAGRAAANPAPELLKFKGSKWGFGVIRTGQTKTARFPFTNVAKQNVTIASVLTGCPCLQVKLDKREYKPGESGDIVIDFTPTEGLSEEYIQTIVVKLEPGNVRVNLHVNGYIPRTNPPKEASPKSE